MSDEAKARDTGLFGVELPDAWPEVSKAAWDKFADFHGHADLTLHFGRESLGGACCQGSLWTTTKGQDLKLLLMCGGLQKIHL